MWETCSYEDRRYKQRSTLNSKLGCSQLITSKEDYTNAPEAKSRCPTKDKMIKEKVDEGLNERTSLVMGSVDKSHGKEAGSHG
ncbi:hypothetical protein Tco_0392921 [Tanacetum coccineum]